MHLGLTKNRVTVGLSSALLSGAMDCQNPKKRRKKHQNPEAQFRFELDNCTKRKDLSGAISLYEAARSQNIRLHQHHLNSLLYLCSASIINPSLQDAAIDYGFRVYNHMLDSNITPTEATITAVSRLAAARGDGDYAFQLVKEMTKYGVNPRLRSYVPALTWFSGNLEADKAYQLEEHMEAMGISMEEPEIAALLKVSSESERVDRVYNYLHKLRKAVGAVRESTAGIVANWFRREAASKASGVGSDMGKIEEAIAKNGGGWHGLGWVGRGDWRVSRTTIGPNGLCGSCSEQLVCVDIDCVETEKFSESVASLALEREVKANFREFMDWLDKHAGYETVVDGANIGLYQQNFVNGGFSLSQLDTAVRELHDRNQKKWPLVILHNRRLQALMENSSNRKLLEEWIAQDAFYATPSGSNDDWYWLYAAVKRKCLLVTNDEMRDHIFELLGRGFILRWKERHQVRYTFIKGKLKLQMPPPYSSVIQESEKGTWHVPISEGSEAESLKAWLCISRKSASVDREDSELSNPLENGAQILQPCHSECDVAVDGVNGSSHAYSEVARDG